MKDKQQLRRQIRQQKQAMTDRQITEKSQALCAMVLTSEAYRQARTIYGYLPFNQEVRTLPLLRQALAEGKQVALPKCYGQQMRFIRMTDLSLVQRSAFGAPEPIGDGPIAEDPTALVLLPGLAFDEQGHRLGYGGGYYDRFLAQEPDHPTIALCYSFQLLPNLPADPHDIPADIIFHI